jgi:FdhD protein
MGRVTTRRPVLKVRVDDPRAPVVRRTPDTLVVEEPLEIRVAGRAVSVTMRTPGDDFDLVAGFLVGEGVVGSADQVSSMRYCAGAEVDGQNTYNVIDVSPSAELDVASLQRNFYTSSSCGVCGKASIDAVRVVPVSGETVPPTDGTAEELVDPATVIGLPDALREAQRVFDRTGGLHAAGLFTMSGELLCVREDVGRHNAVDKVVGWALREGRLPLRNTVLQVSGRASFELVQKAYLAGIPVLSAVSAPSSLAVELAHDVGMTLLGFVRSPGFNVYCGEQRLHPLSASEREA